MISKIPSFKTTDGKVFATIEEAQHEEIKIILLGELHTEWCDLVTGAIIKHAEKMIDILTTTPRSLPSARKANGGRKPRRTKAEMKVAAAESASVNDAN